MALIKCSNCGEEISDQATACPHCNTEFHQEEESAETVLPENPVNPEPAKKEIQQESQKNANRNWNTVGQILGIAGVIVGLVVVFSASSSLPKLTFGSDYNTYSYRALVSLETAIHGATRAVGWMITLFGGYVLCKFGSKTMRSDHSHNELISVQESDSAWSGFDGLPDL